ncbi:MAG: PilZ domain-containing protein [Sedimenticola sp.]|nr:PilZ domain-containing protein [Sedimenticola sp.]
MSPAEETDRRHFHRILFDAPVSVSGGEQEISTRLIDISLNGVLLEMNPPSPWKPGDRLELNIRLGDEAFIDMQAVVVHSERGQLGLTCEHIDMESIAHLRRLVELNLGDESLLERELSALG